VKKTRIKETSIYAVKADEKSQSFLVLRNDRPLMTPAGNPYALPSQALAENIAQEWRAQGEKIIPATMPLTQLAATALDRISAQRQDIIAALLAYIGSELLCHRAAHPAALRAEQDAIWQPYLNWICGRYDMAYKVATGIMPIQQDPILTLRMKETLQALDDFYLAALSSATDSAGSLVLGLALLDGQNTAQEILFAADLDSRHQTQFWGEDSVIQTRQNETLKDLQACELWLGLLGRGIPCEP